MVTRGRVHYTEKLAGFLALYMGEPAGLVTYRGFHLVAVHRGAVDEARGLKPEIPTVGIHSLHIRDEVELELDLGGAELDGTCSPAR